MTDKSDQTRADRQLGHAVMQHVMLEGFASIVVAVGECEYFKDLDPRFEKLSADLVDVLDRLDEIVNEALDTIPGVISREEAELWIEAQERELENFDTGELDSFDFDFFPDGKLDD